MRKERNKLKAKDLEKIENRFRTKYEEFSKISLYDEMNDDGTVKSRGLRSIYREDRMSSTDKRALIAVVDSKLNEIAMIEAKKKREVALEEVNETKND